MAISAATAPEETAVPRTGFWWAIQSDNFAEVFSDGTLWAPLRGSAGQRVASWETLREVRPGDIVFHYSRPALRGISRVVTSPEPAYPPARGYRESADTEGTLILTEPVNEVNVAWKDLVDVLPKGKGPLNAVGTLNRGYFYALDIESGADLLRLSGVRLVDIANAGSSSTGSSERLTSGATDKWALGAVRTEQRFLRGQQLLLRGSSCSLCGHHLPDQFLIAAHIKPRSICSEEERMDTRNVCMLACLFGCDALFEFGYVVVNESGVIVSGKCAPQAIRPRVDALLGRECRAHCDGSRHYFAWHRQLHTA